MIQGKDFYSLTWQEKKHFLIRARAEELRQRKFNIKQTIKEGLAPILSKYPDLTERTKFMLGVLEDVSFKRGVPLETQYANLYLMAIVYALGTFPPVAIPSLEDWNRIKQVLKVGPARWKYALKWQQDLPHPVPVGREFLDIYIPTTSRATQLQLGIFYGASSEFKNFEGMKRRGLEIAAAAARTLAVNKVKEDIETTPVGKMSELGLPGGSGKCPYDTYSINDLCRKLGGPLDIRKSFYKRYDVIRDLDPFSLAAPHNLKKALRNNHRKYLT